ncbi:MAG TPA: HEAT repeat domain-containing protein, partial [Anaeromyxobacteraceae bacterium]|nr:HEAT repeat domain-containing protein [Anaeromyxobacteraceae bacterium]
PSWRVQTAASARIATLQDPSAAMPALMAALAPDAPASRRGAAASALVQIGGPALPGVAQGLASPAAETRTASAEVLGQIGDRRAVPLLASRLSDPDANVRVAAAEALGKLGGEGAVAALRLAAQMHGDTALQLAAIDALAHLGAPPDAARLRQIATNKVLRRAALRLAGFSDEPEVLDLLVEGLREGPRGIRDAALDAFGRVRLRRGRGALARVSGALRAAVDADPSVLRAAEAALASGRPSACAGALAVLECVGDVRHAVAAAIAAEHELARELACDALAAFGPGIGDALLPALPTLPPAPRAAALGAMAALGDARVVGELCADVASCDEVARASAADALGALGALESVPPLVDLLDYPDADISGAAASALASVAQAGPEAQAAVLDACRPAARLTPARCRLLGRIGDAADLEVLRRAILSDDRALRIAALSAVGALSARGAARRAQPPELLVALVDTLAAVRAAAARALALTLAGTPAEPRWPEALTALSAALADPEPVVQAAVVVALGRAHARDQAPALSALAGDAATPAEVAAAAVRALAELGAVPPAVLDRAARHPDPEVVKEAVAAAVAVPGAAGASLLLTSAAHPRWDVRRAVAHAIARRGDPLLLGPARRLAAAEEDPLVAEALAEAIRALEAAS